MSGPVCFVMGCEERATWLMCVFLWPLGYPKGEGEPKMVMDTNVIVCDRHRHESGSVADFFDANSREEIEASCLANNRVPPDFDTAEFHFEAIN